MGNADVARHHEMAQYRRGLYTQLLLFLCSGRPRRTVGLREESCVRHWIRNLTLGCIRQLADMVGSPYMQQCDHTTNQQSVQKVNPKTEKRKFDQNAKQKRLDLNVSGPWSEPSVHVPQLIEYSI